MTGVQNSGTCTSRWPCTPSGGWLGGWLGTSTGRPGGTATTFPDGACGFLPDPRVPAEAQVTDPVYDRNRLDRGHLARRADLLWGPRGEAEVANRHSFFFTNITPQMDNFNQSGQNGIWGRLENAVLATTGTQRVSLLGGPVLAADDPAYGECWCR